MFDDLDICKSVSWSSNHHLAAMIWIRIPKKDTKHEASHGMTGFNFQQAFQHLQLILIIFISFSQFRLLKILQTLHRQVWRAAWGSRIDTMPRHGRKSGRVASRVAGAIVNKCHQYGDTMGEMMGNDGKMGNLNQFPMGFWGYCWFFWGDWQNLKVPVCWIPSDRGDGIMLLFLPVVHDCEYNCCLYHLTSSYIYILYQ